MQSRHYTLQTSDRGRQTERIRLVGFAALVILAGVGLNLTAGPPRLPSGLPRLEQLAAVLTGSSLPVEPLVLVAVDVTWALWLWIVASLGLELLVVCAEAIAHGAAWVRVGRRLADRLTLPLVRRGVAAAFAVQVLSRAVPMVAAQPLDQSEVVLGVPGGSHATPLAGTRLDRETPVESSTYLVQPGDTLWTIAQQAYGSGTAYRRLVDANLGRRMADGQVFTAQGVIRPGWELVIPEPSSRVEEVDGRRWYIVERGDSLSAIAAAVLGDQSRWKELFDLNRSTLSPDGIHRLSDPDVIWPGLRLLLPAINTPLSTAAEPAEADAAETAESDGPEDEPDLPEDEEALMAATSGVGQPPTPTSSQPEVATDLVTASIPPLANGLDPTPFGRRQHVQDPIALVPADLAAEPAEDAGGPANTDRTVPSMFSNGELPIAPLAGGAGLAAVVGAALGARRLRRLRPMPHERESEVVVDGGFAEAPLAGGFAQGVHGGGFDPVAAIIDRLHQFLGEYNIAGVSVVAVRHGRSSTTLLLASGLAQQPLLVDLAPEFAARLEAQAEAWISADQDVVIRLERLRKTRLLPAADGAPRVDPRLTPLGVLYDRQAYSAAWTSLAHVLIASLPGHGADTILTSLMAALTARRSPEQLRVWLIAHPRSLPAPLFELPHLTRLFDANDEAALEHAADALRAELGRRAAHRTDVELVVVVPELTSLGSQALTFELLAGQANDLGVRLVCATSSPDEAVPSPLLAHFGTRMVLRMQDEETSVALLGVADAAFLGGGGRLLLRLDGREPVELYGYQVAPDHLERLVRVMRSAYPPSPGPSVRSPGPASIVLTDDREPEPDERATVAASTPEESTPPPDAGITPAQAEGTPADAGLTPADDQTAPADATNDLANAQQHPGPPVRVICFGGPRVFCAGQQVWPRSRAGDAKPWELLLFLACQPAEGVASEHAVAALWPDDDEAADPAHRFRQLRYRLRHALAAVPGAPDSDGICLERGTLRLDPGIVHSDATEFLGLVHTARITPGTRAIATLERARDLYVADLLEGPDARRYAWLDERGESGVTLREHFRRVFQQVSLRLAELYAESGKLEASILIYRELSEIDPGDERVWRALFRLHAERADRAELVREEWRMREALRALAADINDAANASALQEPSLETVQEYQRLLASLRDAEPEPAAV